MIGGEKTKGHESVSKGAIMMMEHSRAQLQKVLFTLYSAIQGSCIDSNMDEGEPR